MNEPLKIFISYSHKSDDEEWKDRLQVHLGVLEQQGLVTVWEDRQIKSGSLWLDEIRKHIDRADIAIFLVSADSLNSVFILEEEIPKLIKKARFIPIVIKPCAWETVPWLEELQGHTKENTALLVLGDIGREQSFAKLVNEIHDDYLKNKLSNRDFGSTAPESGANPFPSIPSPETNDQRLVSSIKKELTKISGLPFNKLLAEEMNCSDEQQSDLETIAALMLENSIPNTIRQIGDALHPVLTEGEEEYLQSEGDQKKVRTVVNNLLGLLVIASVDHTLIQELARPCSSETFLHFHFSGVRTLGGVEIVIKRLGLASEAQQADFLPSANVNIRPRDALSLKPDKLLKWHQGANIQLVLKEIWNQVFPNQKKEVDDDLLQDDIDMLNATIRGFRQKRRGTRCFFLPYKLLETEYNHQQLYDALLGELPDLIAVGFKAQESASLFTVPEIDVMSAIRMVYEDYFVEE